MRAVVLVRSAVPRETARLVGAVLAAVLLVAPSWANPKGTEAGVALDAMPAVWTPQQLRFKLNDSRAEYTCNDFRNKVRRLLLALGAGKDLQVDASPCVSLVGIRGPSPDPQVEITMQVLTGPAEPPTDPNGIRAHWKSIDLTDHDGPLSPFECSLAKRIVDTLLPLFSTRNVEYNSPSCDRVVNPPHVHLRLEVLVTDQK